MPTKYPYFSNHPLPVQHRQRYRGGHRQQPEQRARPHTPRRAPVPRHGPHRALDERRRVRHERAEGRAPVEALARAVVLLGVADDLKRDARARAVEQRADATPVRESQRSQR